MVRTIKVLFCDLMDLDSRMFIDAAPTAGQLRKLAKAAGWTRSGGADYCETCSASVNDPLNNAV